MTKDGHQHNLPSAGCRAAPPRGQRGAALLVILMLVVMVSAAVLINHLSGSMTMRRRSAQAGEARAALAEARAALIGWSVSHPDQPGRLPYPDRAGDGYDGYSDCGAAGTGASGNSTLLIGRLPILGEMTPESGANCLGNITSWPLDLPPTARESEPLLYAVSANLVHEGVVALNTGLLDVPPPARWLVVLDASGAVISDRVAAVIIAPGPPIAGQNRSGASPAVNDYLDRVTVSGTVYSNADTDDFEEDFIVYPDSDLTASAADNFNDVVAYITADELLAAVERRVLAEASVALARLADGDGDGVPDRAYPWLSPYQDPRSVRGAATGGSTTSLVDVAVADFAAAGVAAGDIVINLDDGSSGEVTAVAGSTVTIGAGLSGGASVDAGEAYLVRPPFRAEWGTGEGHLPVLDLEVVETYDFATAFRLRWQPAGVTTVPAAKPVPIPDSMNAGGGPTLTFRTAGDKNKVQAALDADYDSLPPLPPLFPNPLVVPAPTGPAVAGEGRCTWSTASGPQRVDCTWTGADEDPIPAVQFDVCEGTVTGTCTGPTYLSRALRRQLLVSLGYAGTAGLSATGDLLARDVLVDPGTAAPGVFVTMRYFFSNGGLEYPLGDISLSAAAGAGSGLVTRGIRLDPVDWDETDGADNPPAALNGFAVDDAYPQWLRENEWHHYLYAKVSPDHSSGGGLDCVNVLPANNCVRLDTVAAAAVRSDAQAALIAAGAQIAAAPLSQDRNAGLMADYFEEGSAPGAPVTGNSTPMNGRVRREPVSMDDAATDFNDQVRVVWPPCPAGLACRP